MTNPTDGGPAFPMADLEKCADGLSKREWFAGMIMPSFVNEFNGVNWAKSAAKASVIAADALMAAIESQKGGA